MIRNYLHGIMSLGAEPKKKEKEKEKYLLWYHNEIIGICSYLYGVLC